MTREEWRQIWRFVRRQRGLCRAELDLMDEEAEIADGVLWDRSLPDPLEAASRRRAENRNFRRTGVPF